MRRKMKEDVADDEEIYREEHATKRSKLRKSTTRALPFASSRNAKSRAQRADEGRDDVAAVVGMDWPRWHVHDRSHANSCHHVSAILPMSRSSTRWGGATRMPSVLRS